MAMVVIGDTCVQSITAIRTIIRLPEALSIIVAMAMGGMAIHTIIRLLCSILLLSFMVMGGMCVRLLDLLLLLW